MAGTSPAMTESLSELPKRFPFVPAKAGTQSQRCWIPASAGMNGVLKCDAFHPSCPGHESESPRARERKETFGV